MKYAVYFHPVVVEAQTPEAAGTIASLCSAVPLWSNIRPASDMTEAELECCIEPDEAAVKVFKRMVGGES